MNDIYSKTAADVPHRDALRGEDIVGEILFRNCATRVAVVYDDDIHSNVVPAKRDFEGSNVPRTFSSTPIEVTQVQFDTTCECTPTRCQRRAVQNPLY